MNCNSGQTCYIRLPVAGSLDETHGNEGVSVILQTTRQNLILCGVAVFLPHATENQQKYSRLIIDITLCEHGVSQYGPVGAQLAEIKVEISKKDVIQWAGSKGCPTSIENKRRISLHCFQGKLINSYIYFFNFINFFHKQEIAINKNPLFTNLLIESFFV